MIIPKAGNLIFVHGTGLVPRLIEDFDGFFSHVCVAVNDKEVLQAQGMMRSGIVLFDFSQEYTVVDLRLTDKQKSQVVPVANGLKNYRYDYMQCVGYALQEALHLRIHNLFNNPNHLLCSELADLFLFGIGWVEFDEYLGDYTPNSLYRYVMKKLNAT